MTQRRPTREDVAGRVYLDLTASCPNGSGTSSTAVGAFADPILAAASDLTGLSWHHMSRRWTTITEPT
ncbi:MAG: hypothetical protein ACRDQW_07675 [Haloechinothrix sp.]